MVFRKLQWRAHIDDFVEITGFFEGNEKIDQGSGTRPQCSKKEELGELWHARRPASPCLPYSPYFTYSARLGSAAPAANFPHWVP
ncbi:hypothetical protein PPN31114_04008 [Pandoraea pneumonica]|uniref:Uncharacterized protein n=1 Tax=Pandoraea pneumonica TaxID=2508299 RepID=A0A5E4XPX6_9BURK|nr:hypothetical protein PPN31114_04008 [Pandoraea pneumonica]